MGPAAHDSKRETWASPLVNRLATSWVSPQLTDDYMLVLMTAGPLRGARSNVGPLTNCGPFFRTIVEAA